MTGIEIAKQKLEERESCFEQVVQLTVMMCGFNNKDMMWDTMGDILEVESGLSLVDLPKDDSVKKGFDAEVTKLFNKLTGV